VQIRVVAMLYDRDIRISITDCVIIIVFRREDRARGRGLTPHEVPMHISGEAAES